VKHSEFRVGLEFWCGDKRWRCTDLGTRVIVAISLEPHEVVELTTASDSVGPTRTRRYITNDADWLIGPPYQVAELVFDEYDIEACSLGKRGRQVHKRAAS
jgi:hypothetical protein